MDPLTTVKDLNSLIIPPPTQQWFLILYRYWAIPTSENADRYLFMGHTVTPKEFDISFPLDFPGGSDGKASVYNVGDLGSSPGLGRSPGEGNGNPLQYSCLENPMDRGAW